MNSQHPHGGTGGAPYEREREAEDRHREEMGYRDEFGQRESRDRNERDRERESNERFQSTPRHSSAGSIPIHQPVASRISGAIHSPGGLLANHNGNPPPGHLPGHSAPVANFGGPLQPGDHHNRQVQHGGPGGENSQHQIFAPIAHAQPASGVSQGPATGAAAVFGAPIPQQQQQPQQQLPDGQRSGQPGGAPFRGVTPGQNPIPGGNTNQGQQPILNVSDVLLGDYQESSAPFRLVYRVRVCIAFSIESLSLGCQCFLTFSSLHLNFVRGGRFALMAGRYRSNFLQKHTSLFFHLPCFPSWQTWGLQTRACG